MYALYLEFFSLYSTCAVLKSNTSTLFPSLALLVIYCTEKQTYGHTKILCLNTQSNFICIKQKLKTTAALFVISKHWKQLKCPSICEWLNKQWYIHVMEYYSAMKKSKLSMHTAIQMTLQGTIQ